MLLFTAMAHAAPSILVWGDSLSAGYGLKPGEDWPALLQTRLRQEGFLHEVVNGSVSGETSAGGRTRLPAALARHRPTILILELGANDGLRGLRPQLMGDNLRAMIADARTAGARVLLVGMQMPPNYGPEVTRQFAALFPATARATGAALVPFFLKGVGDDADPLRWFQADRIHPNEAAQPRLLANVWPELKKQLQ